jgi:hypothetical protein
VTRPARLDKVAERAGGGIDASYPSGHATLFHRIGEQGFIGVAAGPEAEPALRITDKLRKAAKAGSAVRRAGEVARHLLGRARILDEVG